MMNTRYTTGVIRVRKIKAYCFVALFFIAVFLLTMYAALLALSVKNVVLRKDLESKITLVRAEVADMESEYIKRIGDITLSRAEGMGLFAIEDKDFIERRVLVGQAY